jgi:hypothetical protein
MTILSSFRSLGAAVVCLLRERSLTLLRPFGFIALKSKIIWLRNFSILSVCDEGYSRNASCALYLEPRFSLSIHDTILYVSSYVRASCVIYSSHATTKHQTLFLEWLCPVTDTLDHILIQTYFTVHNKKWITHKCFNLERLVYWIIIEA